MRTVGLITEYNPFHKGHQYHIEQARRITGADAVVVVMSGNFVQRGEPAIVDKYTRTRMALACGADLVMELPTLYATASAEYFAYGAVQLLTLLGVDCLCFGSECNNLEAMSALADILSSEPEEFQVLLREQLAFGLSFPKARAAALTAITGASDLLPAPNNLLGIEYLKALKKLHSKVVPYTIQRIGMAYSDCNLASSDRTPTETFASASALRTLLSEQSGHVFKASDSKTAAANESASTAAEQLAAYIPAAALPHLQSALAQSVPVFADDLSALLCYKLYSIIHEDSALLLNYMDVSEPLANKLCKIIDGEHFQGTFTELIHKLKSRDFTYSRISRALLHILLDIKLDSYTCLTPYARILGFNAKGQAFLSDCRKTCPIPLITKVADDADLLKHDIYAADIYNQVVYAKSGIVLPNDYIHGVIRQM